MREYDSWSFADRSFIFAVAVSLLWHLFWFFSVTIIVTPPTKRTVNQPRIVSLGPVLDDTIFKTLIDSRPEISKAFYRQPADFSSATDIPAESIERFARGEVVSIPFSQKIVDSIKSLMADVKASPSLTPYFELEAPLGVSQVISRPKIPSGAEIPAGSKVVEIEFSLNDSGSVFSPEVLVSSGDLATDLAWEKHLQQWIFSQEGFLTLGTDTRARIRFRVPDTGV